MPQADHGRRDDQVGGGARKRVEALKNRVDALEHQSQQSKRDQHAAEGREQRLRKFNAVLTRLSLGQALAEGKAEDAYREICVAAADAINVDRVGIWFLDEGDSVLRAVNVYDRRTGEHECSEVLYADRYPRYFKALCDGRTLPADDAHSDPRTCEMTDDYLIPCGITSMLDAPVRIDGRVTGVICHEHIGPPRKWTMDELTFAGSMSDFVALTLQASRRREAERESERQRAFLQQIIDISPNLVFILDRDGRFVFVNQAIADLTGSEAEQLIGRDSNELITDADQGLRIRQMDTDVLDGVQENVVAIEEFPDAAGKSHWYQIAKRPITAMDGSGRQVLGVAVDITERKHYEERLATLVRELDHRVKNNLFAVMIMAEQSAATVESMEDFVPAFTGRIRAMAIAHEILAASNWQGASLAELIQRLLQPYTVFDPSRVSAEGPDVVLPPSVAPALCTMLHELVTNAAQHGSLSSPDGALEIRWQMRDGSLRLSWQECDGPTVRQPERTGFGIELVERITEHQLRGEAKLDFDPSGLRCEIGIPIESHAREETSAR